MFSKQYFGMCFEDPSATRPLTRHSLASWFIATITGWGTGATVSSSILGRLGSGSWLAEFSASMLEGLWTSTGGDVDAWAAKI